LLYIYGIFLGRGLVENDIWARGRGWLKTSEYHHIGERESKIAQKNHHVIFEHFLGK